MVGIDRQLSAIPPPFPEERLEPRIEARPTPPDLTIVRIGCDLRNLPRGVRDSRRLAFEPCPLPPQLCPLGTAQQRRHDVPREVVVRRQR